MQRSAVTYALPPDSDRLYDLSADRASQQARSPSAGSRPDRPHTTLGHRLLQGAGWFNKAPDGSAPALDFLNTCPGKIDAELTAVLDALAAAPPPQFSGGSKWEAMHGSMTGWHEIRLTGPGREQFRLFRLLENAED